MSQATLIERDHTSGPQSSIFSTLRAREAMAGYLFIAPFLIFFLVFVVKGVVFATQMSFYDWNVLAPVHKPIGLDNYIHLMKDSLWWIALKNTFVFAVITVIGTTIVALFAALAVNRPILGQSFFRVVFYAPGLLSVGVVGLIWVWLMDSQFGVLNFILRLVGLPTVNWLGDANIVLGSLSLTTIWWGFGFPMLIFLAGLQNIPDTLYEAARIDGANSRQIFSYVTLPLLRPTILFVTVTQFIAQLQVFGQPYIMTNGGGPGEASYTVIIYLFNTAWRYLHAGYGSAIAVSLAIIMIVITIIQFRVLGQRDQG